MLENMAGTTGLEPAASAVTGQRSNQLNYVPTRQMQREGKMRCTIILTAFRRDAKSRWRDLILVTETHEVQGTRSHVRRNNSAEFLLVARCFEALSSGLEPEKLM